jgi:predicted Ser/Thr protein kinase
MLDSIGLDHGELSHAPKNVLVNRFGQACIVDFESASTARRVANVTSLLQYFLFGRVSKTLRASQIFPNRRNIVKALGEYKREGSVENFQRVLGALGLL